MCGPGSSVGTATGYGLDSLGIESRWGRDFPHLSRPVPGATQTPVQWVPGLSWGKERPGHDAHPSPLLVLWSKKGRAIPLLPLWAVRPVQSLSACTRVYCLRSCVGEMVLYEQTHCTPPYLVTLTTIYVKG